MLRLLALAALSATAHKTVVFSGRIESAVAMSIESDGDLVAVRFDRTGSDPVAAREVYALRGGALFAYNDRGIVALVHDAPETDSPFIVLADKGSP